jgi:hypothetical protein
MKQAFASIAVIGALLLALCGPALAAEVTQGKCLTFNEAAKTIKLDEFGLETSKEAPYGKPTGVQTEFDVSQAKIGIPPKPGDVLRISYVAEGGVKKALKVMNVSKQNLMKK